MDKAHGGAGLVDMLPACAGRAVDLHFDILGPDIDLGLLHLRKHRDRCGRCVDSSAGLRLRDTLHAVDAGFKFQSGIRARALNFKIGFFYAAKFGFVVVQQRDRPALRLGIHRVHPVQAVREQCAFLAADAAPDLHDHALVVVRVAREQENFQFLLQFLQLFLVRRKFLLTQRLHVRVKPFGEHGAQVILLLHRFSIAAVGRNDGFKLPLFF